MTDLAFKALVALVSGIVGAIGPFILLQVAERRATLAQVECDALKIEVQQLRLSLDRQRVAVEHWKAEGEAAGKRVRDAEAVATKARRESVERANVALSASVPAECELAMRWASEQAPKLAEGWR